MPASALEEPPETLRAVVELQELLLEGKSVGTYVRRLAEMLGSPVCLMDLSFRSLAHHTPVPLHDDPVWGVLENAGSLSDDYIAFNVRRHISEDARRRSEPTFVAAANGYHAMFLCGVLVNGEPAGTLGALQLGEPLEASRARILGYAARQLGSELEKHKYAGWFSPTTVAQLYLELLTVTEETLAPTVARARASGLADAPRTVVVVPLGPEKLGGVEYLRRRVMAQALYTECLGLPSRGEVAVVGEHHPGYGREEWMRAIGGVLRSHGLVGAASDPCASLAGLADALACARAAAAAARRLGAGAGLVRFSDLRVEALRECVQVSPRPECFVHPALAAIHAHDLAAHSELERTLDAFLAQGCNATATASALNVHRNTLRERLAKVEEVGGISLSDPRTRLELHISLFLQGKTPARGQGDCGE